jgi:hypothetical protein
VLRGVSDHRHRLGRGNMAWAFGIGIAVDQFIRKLKIKV